MKRRSNPMVASLIAVSLAALSGVSCGGGDTPNATCMELMSYTPTSLTPLSFATDIMPILTDTTSGKGCSQQYICHGDPAMAIDSAGMKFMVYLGMPAATVQAELMGTAVNAPSMNIVVAGNVQNSFLAYKVSGSSGVACVTSKCQAGAGSNPITACGAPMPSNGTIAQTDRTKILDWIANGANP